MRRHLTWLLVGPLGLMVGIWGLATTPSHAQAPRARLAYTTPRQSAGAHRRALARRSPPSVTTTTVAPSVPATTLPAPAPVTPPPVPVVEAPVVMAPAAPTTASPPTAAPGAVQTVPNWQGWELVAQCETGGNWQARGSVYSGGLGMTNANWQAFGGTQFAWTAATASPAEQMVVANRVETPPYSDTPAGGCHGW